MGRAAASQAGLVLTRTGNPPTPEQQTMPEVLFNGPSGRLEGRLPLVADDAGQTGAG